MKLIATTAALLVASAGLGLAAVQADAPIRFVEVPGLNLVEGVSAGQVPNIDGEALQVADAGTRRFVERPFGGWRWGDDRRDDRWGGRDDGYDRDDRDGDRDGDDRGGDRDGGRDGGREGADRGDD